MHALWKISMILVHSVSVGTPCNGAPVAKCGVRLQRRIRKQEPRSGIEGKDGVMSRRCSHTHQRLCLEALAVQEQPLPCLAFAVGPALIAPCGAFAGGPAFRGTPAVRRQQAVLRMVEVAPLVVVAGATGRVGRLVVQRLLNPPFNSTQTPVRVRALVRDLKKAESVLPQDPSLEIVRCDLLSAAQIKAACGDAAAAVWCATGFSDSQDASLVSKLMGAFKLKFPPQESVDISAMKAMGACFKDRPSPLGGPSIVMCSSAGVTRPTWPEDKKQRLLASPPRCLTACHY